jgi:adenylate cyclase
VTVVLSFALYRARDALFDAIQSRAAADDLKQFFAPEVAASITQSDSLPGAGTSDLRRAAILFVDVRGFTRTAERLPPACVIAALTEYQEVALTEIERHGGRIDKFLGDGILATFGAVQDSETCAADAVRAAVALIAALDAAQPRFAAAGWPGDLVTGVGLASGEVTVGVVGAHGRLEFTVIGNAVNTAAKLESANKALGTRALCDGATLAAAQAQGLEIAPPDIRRGVTVAGLSEPLDIVVLA